MQIWTSERSILFAKILTRPIKFTVFRTSAIAKIQIVGCDFSSSASRRARKAEDTLGTPVGHPDEVELDDARLVLEHLA